jgi:hypothetical protein
MQMKDRTLFRKLALMVVPVIFYLTIWTTIRPPQPEMVRTTEQNQKFYICNETWIDYGLLIGSSKKA